MLAALILFSVFLSACSGSSDNSSSQNIQVVINDVPFQTEKYLRIGYTLKTWEYEKDNLELHFFDHKDLNIEENYGQVYIRVNDIELFYQSLLDNNIPIHPHGSLQTKPWGQKEFALLDPYNNLLTFGQKL